jgi:hypothetical protein
MTVAGSVSTAFEASSAHTAREMDSAARSSVGVGMDASSATTARLGGDDRPLSGA